LGLISKPLYLYKGGFRWKNYSSLPNNLELKPTPTNQPAFNWPAPGPTMVKFHPCIRGEPSMNGAIVTRNRA